jgi:hypothetical protein
MDGGDIVFDEPQLADKASLSPFGTFNLISA